MLTVDDVKMQVKEIAECSGNAAQAHSMEDNLWADVLQAVADGSDQAKLLAIEALKTQEIEFGRWCYHINSLRM